MQALQTNTRRKKNTTRASFDHKRYRQNTATYPGGLHESRYYKEDDEARGPDNVIHIAYKQSTESMGSVFNIVHDVFAET